MYHPTGRAREEGVRRTLYAMASTMGEDPNAFSGRLVWRAAQQCNKLAEVRDENSIRIHRGENTGRTFPLPVRQLPWAPRLTLG